jgi:hypothetical protein
VKAGGRKSRLSFLILNPWSIAAEKRSVTWPRFPASCDAALPTARLDIVDPKEVGYTCFVPFTLIELKQVIDSGDFDKFIGEVEGQLLEVKGRPYRFEVGSDAKREFAKDVAAFANARGGGILIGMHTKTGPLHTGEEIVEIRPIPGSTFNPDQYRKILAEWVYPKPAGVEILLAPFGPDAAKGVGVIFIPPQDDRAKPFLIKRVISEDKKSSELMIGFVERRVDGTEVRTIAEIHHTFRVGLSFEREILGRIANLESLVGQHFSAKIASESLEQREESLTKRIARLIDEANK